MNDETRFRRTFEIEEFTNLHLIHPLAARLTPVLAGFRVSPNTVSFGGMLCGVLAGWAYFHYQDIRFTFAGLLLMAAWHVLDGVDGQLARLTNTQSEFGKVIDGIADNVTFLAVYLGLGLSLYQIHGMWVWLLIALAGVAHSLQAATYEVQRQEYEFWGWNKKPAELRSVETLRSEHPPQTFVQHIVFALGRSYVRLQHIAAQIDLPYRASIATALARQPEQADMIRQHYREIFAPLVHRWSIMSSNYRTLLIFVCAALHVPLWYFVIELMVLTPLTILLVRLQKKKSREFSQYLNLQTSY